MVGVPENPAAVLDFLTNVKRMSNVIRSKVPTLGPLVVHCRFVGVEWKLASVTNFFSGFETVPVSGARARLL